MRKFLVLFSIFFVMTTVLFAAGSAPTSDAKKRMAREALGALRHAYVERSRGRFFELISQEPNFKLVDLKFDIATNFTSYSQVNWNLIRDHTLVEGDKVSIKTHWKKRMVSNQDGQVQTSKGQTEFIFLLKDNEARLISFLGDKPF